MPSVVSHACGVSGGTGTSGSMRSASAWRCVQYRTAKVMTMATTDGSVKRASQPASGGIRSPNSTRLAGFEIGRTKLAALAMNAQA